MELLNTTPSEILEHFQSAYYDQIGSRMQIGSEEYILSSVFTYVMSYYAALINKGYKNQLISSAEGEFLDNIATRYGLSRTPEVYSNPYFEGIFSFNPECQYYRHIYGPEEFSIDIADHTYKNFNLFTCNNSSAVRLVCVDKHNDALNSNELKNILSDCLDSNGKKIFNIDNSTVSDLLSVEKALNDDDFRKYIEASKYLYTPGVASAFEALAKNATSGNITDARVRIQSDQGFIPGNVDLFCKPYHQLYDTTYSDMVENIDIPSLPKIINDKNLLVIGQTLNVHSATRIEDARAYLFWVSKEYENNTYRLLFSHKFKACIGLLQNRIKINEPFAPATLGIMMMQPITATPEECGITQNHPLYELFDQFKDLPVIGLKNVSNTDITPSAPDSYIYFTDINMCLLEFM